MAYIMFDKGIAEKIVVGKQATDVHTNNLSQMLAAYYMRDYDMDVAIEKSRKLYQHRCNYMLECMDRYFPDCVTYTRPEGGIFIWVTLPDGMDSGALFKEAVEQKVAFVPGNAFMTDLDKPCNAFRLNYSTMPDDKIEQGIKLLGELLKQKLN